MELLTIGAQELLKKMERATGLEPATFSLGIKTTGPLFSILTKLLRKNIPACNTYRACVA
jgi:hypothetical protein